MKVASIQVVKKRSQSFIFLHLLSKFFLSFVRIILIPSFRTIHINILLSKTGNQTAQRGQERLTTREMRKKESAKEATRNALSHTRLVSTHNNAREEKAAGTMTYARHNAGGLCTSSRQLACIQRSLGLRGGRPNNPAWSTHVSDTHMRFPSAPAVSSPAYYGRPQEQRAAADPFE